MKKPNDLPTDQMMADITEMERSLPATTVSSLQSDYLQRSTEAFTALSVAIESNDDAGIKEAQKHVDASLCQYHADLQKCQEQQ